MSVREELEKLTRLQEIDLKIDRAKKLKSSAPQAFSQLEKEIAGEQAKLDAANASMASLEKQKRQYESENMMDNDRIKNVEARLAGVTNNKEFHAASKESDKAKKMISDREKASVDLNAKIATQVKIVEEMQTRMNALLEQLESKKTEVGGQLGEADKEIANIASDRSAIVSEIQAGLITKYNRIRTVYTDAVAFCSNGHCTACNVALPPQLYIQVQKGLELISCPSCQRLLYYRMQ